MRAGCAAARGATLNPNPTPGTGTWFHLRRCCPRVYLSQFRSQPVRAWQGCHKKSLAEARCSVRRKSLESLRSTLANSIREKEL